MKTIYTSKKYSYGPTFFAECDTLQDLKHAILRHYSDHENFEYTEDKFTEELFEKAVEEDEHVLFKVELHDNEELEFDQHNGESVFRIVKKDIEILSNVICLNERV